jgi:hypothetical protein
MGRLSTPVSRPGLPRFAGLFLRIADFPPDARFLRGGDLGGEGLWRDDSAGKASVSDIITDKNREKILTYCHRVMIPDLLQAGRVSDVCGQEANYLTMNHICHFRGLIPAATWSTKF